METTPMTHTELKAMANRIRQHCIRMTGKANTSHIGSALSTADIMAALYGKALRYDPKRPDWPDRDRFIMSKGHACTALYATLAESGFFPAEALETFYQNGSPLAGHVMHKDNPGVELSTGSLGHGLPVAAGMAIAAKRDGRISRMFCLMSDGECDEGSVWESALFAPQHQLDNLVVIIDYNGIQSLDMVKNVIDLDPFAAKWRAFRWSVVDVDGHNMQELEETLTRVPFEVGRPSCIIAHTVKGKGVSFMENKLLWHYRAPLGEDLTKALAELGQNI
jgi:transketolase